MALILECNTFDATGLLHATGATFWCCGICRNSDLDFDNYISVNHLIYKAYEDCLLARGKVSFPLAWRMHYYFVNR